MGNLFYSYEKDKIAQFFISGEKDFSFCNNYFQVSDSDVIRSVVPKFFFKKRKQTGEQSVAAVTKSSRNVPNMLLRTFAWDLGLWKRKEYKQWLKDFSPEVVLLQVGDCPFMFRIAMQVARKFHAKLIVYNTEGYIFKKHNYFRDGHNVLYSIFIGLYKRRFKKIMANTEHCIYLNQKLKDDYDQIFNVLSSVIYNSSSIDSMECVPFDKPTISYIGNLGLSRDVALTEIADVAAEQGLEINVYGKASEQTKALFKQHPAIHYHGFISYDDVIKVMQRSTILLHVESFDPFYVVDSKYGFSGKIADSLSSGRAFLMYCPKEIACAEYIVGNGIETVADSKEGISILLKQYSAYNDDYKALVSKQLLLAKENHDLKDNSERFVEIINRDHLEALHESTAN